RGAVRIEARQHAVDGVLQDLLVADLIDVFGADSLEDVAEDFQELGGLRMGLILRHGTAQYADGRPGHDTDEESRTQQQAMPETPLAEVHSLYPSGPWPHDTACRQAPLRGGGCRQHGTHTTIVFMFFSRGLIGSVQHSF